MPRNKQTNFNPALQLMFYTNSDGVTYIEKRRFTKHLTEYRPTSYSPLAEDEAKTLKQYFKIKEKQKQPYVFTGLIPENVFYVSTHITDAVIAWHKPSHKNYLLLQNKRGKVIYPNLVFIANKDTLKVFLYKKWEGIKTKLYYAPFNNLYNNGSLCLGTADAPGANLSLDDFITEWEKCFFHCEFNTENDSRYSNDYLAKAYKKMFDNLDQLYSHRNLIRNQTKLYDAIPSIQL